MAKDKAGRPIVVVTGYGVVTSLGAGKEDNWAKLTAGQSGIREITRFATDGLKTRIAGTVDFVSIAPVINAPELSQRFAEMAGAEAIAHSGIGSRGDFPGPLFLGVAPVEIEWQQRHEVAVASGANEALTYNDLTRAGESGRFENYYERFLFGSVADGLAEKFGTKGAPISLSTACATGATSIQLGVEAIRRGETDAALCIGTDGSVNAESLIRFSLLSALSASNDPPSGASKPFSKNRDGFVMAEGAGALVLESLEHAQARGANILGVIEGLGEMADLFHRTRSAPDGKPTIGCISHAIADAGTFAGRHRLHQPARHRHAGERQERVHLDRGGIRRARQEHPGVVEQVDDRPYALGGGRGRKRVQPDDARAPAHSADDQLRGAGSGDPARRGAERGA